MKTKSIVHHLVQLPYLLPLCALILMALASGCRSTGQYGKNPGETPKEAKDIELREADVLRITFPGADNLDTVQTIRRDGKITLPLIGEVVAAGKTPTALEKELVGQYSSQLVSSKEITVTVQSSTFPVFVTGAVMRPGQVISDHPITALEAIMESGGPDYQNAKLSAVRIIRNKNGDTKNFTVNLEGLKNGTAIDSFNLQPSDIVFVPRKMVWF